jgi:thiol-disulfide isomerase/thioredoxin
MRLIEAVTATLLLAAEPVELALPGLDGEPHDIAQYRGKWVVINYWATWCPPCIFEIPELIAFHDEHADRDAVVVGVNLETIDGELLGDFVARLGVNYPILREDPADPTSLGRVFGLPTTYLVRPDGELAARHNGPLTARQLEQMIRAPLPEPAAPPARTRT